MDRYDLENLIREHDELVEQENAAKALVRSLRTRRGMKRKKVLALARQLLLDPDGVRRSMGPADVPVPEHETVDPRVAYTIRRTPELMAEQGLDLVDVATAEAMARAEWDVAHPGAEVDPDVDGHPCPECSGAGGDGLCACLGTGWIEAE